MKLTADLPRWAKLVRQDDALSEGHPASAPFTLYIQNKSYACVSNGWFMLAVESTEALRPLPADRCDRVRGLLTPNPDAKTLRLHLGDLKRWLSGLIVDRRDFCCFCYGIGEIDCECGCGHTHKAPCECVSRPLPFRLGLALFNAHTLTEYLALLPDEPVTFITQQAESPEESVAKVGLKVGRDRASWFIGENWIVCASPMRERVAKDPPVWANWLSEVSA